MREQSAHHRRSGVYKDDQKRSRVIMAYPRVKYINVDVVLKKVEKEYESAKFAVRVDMPSEPLSHALISVMMDRRYYYDIVKEEVLAVQDVISGSFLLPVRKKRYEYGQVGSKKGKLERRSLERCRQAASSNSCPGVVLDWQQVPPNRL